MRNFFSSQTRKILLIVIILLLVMLGYTASQLAVETGNELKVAQNRIADLERRLDMRGEQEASSLADAMQIVPLDSIVTGGARLSEDIYWVSAESLDGAGHPTVQFWSVDVPGASASLIAQRIFPGADVVTSIDTSSISDEYAIVETQALADGNVEIYVDVLDVRTGQLLASVHWANGTRVSIQKDAKSLDLSLPVDICKGLSAGSLVDVSALMVQGQLKKLPRPSKVECLEDAFTNTVRPDDIGMPLYARSLQDGSETVELTLPWGDAATINLQDLSPSGVSFGDLLR